MHAETDVAPITEVQVPALQVAQGETPDADQDPAGQTIEQAAELVEPLDWVNNPPEQLVHVVAKDAPIAPEYVPALQLMQDTAASADDQVPALQLPQAEAPAEENDPG